jgi:hypothetical protein
LEPVITKSWTYQAMLTNKFSFYNKQANPKRRGVCWGNYSDHVVSLDIFFAIA